MASGPDPAEAGVTSIAGIGQTLLLGWATLLPEERLALVELLECRVAGLRRTLADEVEDQEGSSTWYHGRWLP